MPRVAVQASSIQSCGRCYIQKQWRDSFGSYRKRVQLFRGLAFIDVKIVAGLQQFCVISLLEILPECAASQKLEPTLPDRNLCNEGLGKKWLNTPCHKVCSFGDFVGNLMTCIKFISFYNWMLCIRATMCLPS